MINSFNLIFGGRVLEALKKLIGENDAKLTTLENQLVDEINEVYDAAIKAAIVKFKSLEKMPDSKKVSSDDVQHILNETMTAFSKRFNKLVNPIKEAMLVCYEQGLKETARILAQTDFEKTKKEKE